MLSSWECHLLTGETETHKQPCYSPEPMTGDACVDCTPLHALKVLLLLYAPIYESCSVVACFMHEQVSYFSLLSTVHKPADLLASVQVYPWSRPHEQ